MKEVKNSKSEVLFLSPVSHFKGGAERCLMEFLDNPYICPEVASPFDGPLLENARLKNIPTHVVPFGDIDTIHRPFSFLKGVLVLKSLFKAAKDLKEITRKRKISIVHSNGLKAHIVNCVCKLIGGPKAIVHIHDIPLTTQEKLVWKLIYVLCDRMLIVSRPCWPTSTLPSKCKIIHNGTILHKKMTHEFKVTKSEINVGFIGRIHPAKGLHLLLNWCAYALKEGYKIKLSIRGSFSEDAPTYQEEIEKIVSELGLTYCTEFLGHINEPEKVYEFLDVVVVPSHVPDPLPRSVMEPMSYGIPVFGYPAGGIPEMIEHGKSGFLVKDQYEFSESLRLLAENYEEIVFNAQEKIKNEFTIERLYDDLQAVYKSLE